MKTEWVKPKLLADVPEMADVEFQIVPLTRLQMWDLQDYQRMTPRGMSLTAQGRQFLVRTALKDWRGLTDSQGNTIDCPAGDLNMMLKAVTPGYLDAVAFEIFELSGLTEQQRKN